MPLLWDFGNPRFVLGLAYLTDVLHPGEVQTGVRTETEEFYQRWYRMSYEDAGPNRSFFRPSSGAKECIIRVFPKSGPHFRPLSSLQASIRSV